LDVICNAVNATLATMNESVRITWGAGEIRPVSDKERIHLIDMDS
jgi:hypothetical protein